MAKQGRSRGKAYRRPLPKPGKRFSLDDLDVTGVDESSRGWRIVTRYVTPALLCVALGWTGIAVTSSLAATFGGGTPGTFTAQYCLKGHRSCIWEGYFVSDNGRDVRDGVEVEGSGGLKAVGQQIRALDTGDPLSVYSAGSRYQWIAPSILLLGFLGLSGWWLARVPGPPLRRTIRRRLRARRTR